MEVSNNQLVKTKQILKKGFLIELMGTQGKWKLLRLYFKQSGLVSSMTKLCERGNIWPDEIVGQVVPYPNNMFAMEVLILTAGY